MVITRFIHSPRSAVAPIRYEDLHTEPVTRVEFSLQFGYLH